MWPGPWGWAHTTDTSAAEQIAGSLVARPRPERESRRAARGPAGAAWGRATKAPPDPRGDGGAASGPAAARGRNENGTPGSAVLRYGGRQTQTDNRLCFTVVIPRPPSQLDAGGPVVTRSDGTGPADAPFGLASLERQFVAHGRDPDGRDPARRSCKMTRHDALTLGSEAKGNFNT